MNKHMISYSSVFIRVGLLFLNILVYVIYELMGVNVHLYNLLLRFSSLDPDTKRGCKDS